MRRFLKGALSLLLVVALAGGGWLLWDRYVRERGVPGEVLAAERALATPDVVLLASADTRTWGRIAAGDAGHELPRLARAVADRLGVQGLPLAQATRRALLALYPGDGPRLRAALVLFGSFGEAAVRDALRAGGAQELSESWVAGQQVLWVFEAGKQGCGDGSEWGVSLTPDRVVVARGEDMESLLTRLAGPGGAGRDLSGFGAFRGEQVLSVALFPPAEPAAPGAHPVLRSLLDSARSGLLGIEAAYFGISTGLLRPALRLAVALQAGDPATAQRVAASWRDLRSRSSADLSRVTPVLGALHEEAVLSTQDATVIARASIDRDRLRDMPELPAELLVLASRVHAGSSDGEPSVDRLDLQAPGFLTSFPPASLRRYDPRTPLAGPADVTVGPFGIRLDRVTRSDAESGLALELRAVAHGIPNLGDGVQRPQLRVHSVTGQDGRELLRQEGCAAVVNGAPAELALDLPSELLRAEKVVRLVSDAKLHRVEKVTAELSMRLPTRTESVVLDAPSAGDVATLEGATVQITGVHERGFSYRISGDTDRVLHVQAINRRHRPLASPSAWSAEPLISGGRVGARDFVGELGAVQVVFALEHSDLRYPFELEGGRPGTDGEELATESVRFIEYSPKQYDQEFSRAFGRAFRPHAPPHALTTAGPFTLVFEELHEAGALDPNITVLAPDIPNLTYNLNGLELVLDRLHFEDGSVEKRGEHATAEVPWRERVQPKRRFGRSALSNAVSVETGLHDEDAVIRRVDGKLVLRLASGVYSVSLPAVEPGSAVTDEGVTYTLSELGRDSLTLHVSGAPDKVVTVRAFEGEEGRELLVSGAQVEESPSGTDIHFTVHGQAARLELLLASKLHRSDYAFRLELPQDQVPAAARRLAR